MASINDVMRLNWICDTYGGETAVFRMHCAKKGSGIYSLVHGAMATFFEDIGIDGTYPILGRTELNETRLQEWDDTAKQFVQVSVYDQTGLVTETANLPQQIAAVLTLKATQPFGARRQSYTNRAFLGPVQLGAISGTGQLESTYIAQTLGTLEAFQDELETIANASGVTFTDGLAIVSEKLEIAEPIVYASMDTILDTQRRRRRSLTGSKYSTIDF